VAIQASPKRFVVQLSNVDSGVYTQLDLRVSQQASETVAFLLTRIVAYCFLARDDANSVLSFSKGGISTPDEAAIARMSLDGRLLLWCEIGNPSAERLHKAGKSGAAVVLFTHHDAERQVGELRASTIHRKETLEVYSLEAGWLSAFAAAIGERGASFELTIAEDTMYVVIDGTSLPSGAITRWSL
jgi:uncharacterized protein YaeQ